MKKKEKGWLKRFLQCHQHPVIMVSYTAKYLWLLVIPVLKYLIAVKFDLKNWIEANWVEILTISLIFGYAFLRWVFVYFEMEDDAIVAHTGYFGITKTKVYFSEISTVTLSQGYIFRAIHACNLYIDTDAKSIQKADIALTLTKKQAIGIYECITSKSPHKAKYVYNAKRSELMIFSLLFSSTLSGMLILVSLIYETNKIVGRALEQQILERVNTEIEKAYVYVPKYFLIAGLVIAGGWLISFTANLMRHWNFSCIRCSNYYIIKSGKGTKRQHVLMRDKIIRIAYSQSMLMKLFKICSVSIKCTGYGKRSQEISAIIPITTNKQVDHSLKLLMPGIPDIKCQVKTGKKDIMKFISLPAFCCLIPPAADYFLKQIFPAWTKEIKMLAIIVFIPLVWLTIVKFGAAFCTGIGIENGCVKLSCCRFYQFHSTIVSADKISMVQLKRYPWQYISQSCNITFYINSENTDKFVIKGINYEAAKKLLCENGFNI